MITRSSYAYSVKNISSCGKQVKNITFLRMNNTTELNITANNGSLPFRPPWPWPHFSQLGWILGVLVTHSILAVFITFSNLIVLIAFYKNSKLRTTTNLVIISMATADLLVGAVVIPIWLYSGELHFMIGPPYEKWQQKMFRSYLNIDQALGLNSIYQLVLLHGLRSYSIAFPLKHRQMNKRPVVIACLLVWAICIAFPPSVREIVRPSCRNCFVYITLIANIGLPLVLMTTANIILWRSVTKSSQARQKKDTKILVTVAILIGILCVCFLPFLIVNVIVQVENLPNFNFKAVMALKFLHFCNSALNPPVYALRHPEIARTFKAMFCKASTRDVGMSTRGRMTNNATTSQSLSTIS
ncbi:probable G-protein coupled receptor No9 isoform X2 [Dendronephthya gigantea]|uniref:probable G-protein coupled receptor No9 isoform X2 n=1 Tax=Dendronephthya gigantea TaxID=151771 RepID=UPI00106D589A|nr:probable G-protein coupled receptor No9 isoform X2 [Dendronephthya gigantea]